MKRSKSQSIPVTEIAGSIASNEVGSKIAGVRTNVLSESKTATIEVRLQPWLKRAVKKKAESENTSLSTVVEAGLIDYVSGDLTSRSADPETGLARSVQGAVFRRLQSRQFAVLVDLRTIGVEHPASPLADKAVQLLLADLERKTHAIFEVLRNVR